MKLKLSLKKGSGIMNGRRHHKQNHSKKVGRTQIQEGDRKVSEVLKSYLGLKKGSRCKLAKEGDSLAAVLMGKDVDLLNTEQLENLKVFVNMSSADDKVKRRRRSYYWRERKLLKEDGYLLLNTRYKARLVIKGCAQIKGYDYSDTYALVAKLTTIRILLCLANCKSLYVHHLDVKNAFLYGVLKDEIFMLPPEGVQWVGLKRVLRYLKGTLDLGSRFKGISDVPLLEYADAVCWATKKQQTVALSTAESEFVTLASAT
ncbi:hypothetical protein PR048_032814, partial [Dryococelus australis]